MVYTPVNYTALQNALSKWYALANNASDSNALNTANNYSGSEYNGNPNTWNVTAVTDMTELFSRISNIQNYLDAPDNFVCLKFD